MLSWPSCRAAVAAQLLAAGSVLAQDPSHLVDPFDVRSSSGRYVLRVEPNEAHGRGAASYALSQDGEVLWAKELDCTLEEVVVGDDGAFAGAARRSTPSNETELVLLLSGPDGAPRYRLGLPPEPGMMHGSDYPSCNGALLLPEQDRVVFRVVHHRQGFDTYEEWRVVEWSTGKEIATSVPAAQLEETRGVNRFAVVRGLRGTPLVVAQALVLDFDPLVGAMGTTFAVFDLTGKPVWQRREARDYVLEDMEETTRLWGWVAEHGALFDCEEPRHFEFALVREGKRVRCRVSEDPARPDAWSVAEVGREDYDLPFDEEDIQGSKPTSDFALELVGTIDVGETAPPVQLISSFDIDDRGHLGAVMVSEGAPARFVLRKPSGEIVSDLEFHLDVPRQLFQPQATWLQADRWLVHVTEYAEDDSSRAHAWWLDLPGGTLTKIPEFECHPIDEADGTLDGGFLALTSTTIDNGPVQTLSSFDRAGKLRWRAIDANGQRDSGLFSPEAVAFSPQGEIGVLDNIKGLLQRFDSTGKLVSEIVLEDVVGWELRYPTELAVDGDGNWIVGDLLGSPPILRISREAQLTSSFETKHANGAAFRAGGGVRVAPDGSLWTSDGFALMRLSALGVVDHVAGDPPDDDQLGLVQEAHIDHAGRILLVDARTKAVHIFGSDGRRQAVCKLAADDLDGTTRIGWIAVDRELSTYVGPVADEEHRYRKFAPNGKPLGACAYLGVNLFQPATGRRWQLASYEGTVQLFSPEGVQLKRIDKGADGRWLDHCRQSAVAMDGTLVVEARESYHVFSPDGEPLRSLPIPTEVRFAILALSKSYVFASGAGKLWRTDLETGAIRCAELEVNESSRFLVPAWREELGELWLADLVAKKVFRYRVNE
jgi:sugar lactone lactonase YvrE